jgi:hypothetical protein
MSIASIQYFDNGGRRVGLERRSFSYDGVLPEMRADTDRRSGEDRRCYMERRKGLDRRNGSHLVRTAFGERRSPSDRRSRMDRRKPVILAPAATDPQWKEDVGTTAAETATLCSRSKSAQDNDFADPRLEPIQLTDLVYTPERQQHRTSKASKTPIGPELDPEPILLTDLVYAHKGRPRDKRRR